MYSIIFRYYTLISFKSNWFDRSCSWVLSLLICHDAKCYSVDFLQASTEPSSKHQEERERRKGRHQCEMRINIQSEKTIERYVHDASRKRHRLDQCSGQCSAAGRLQASCVYVWHRTLRNRVVEACSKEELGIAVKRVLQSMEQLSHIPFAAQI